MLNILTKELIDKSAPLYLELVKLVHSWVKENDDGKAVCATYAISILAAHAAHCWGDNKFTVLKEMGFVAKRELETGTMQYFNNDEEYLSS